MLTDYSRAAINQHPASMQYSGKERAEKAKKYRDQRRAIFNDFFDAVEKLASEKGINIEGYSISVPEFCTMKFDISMRDLTLTQ